MKKKLYLIGGSSKLGTLIIKKLSDYLDIINLDLK